MRRCLATLLLIVGLLPLAGCCTTCPGADVPVSLESLYNFNHYFGHCAFHYPYSCPPCPYDCGCGVFAYPVSEHEVQPVPKLEPAPVPEPATDEN